MGVQENPLDSVVTGPPNVEPEQVLASVVDQFGMTGELTQLISERDLNFRLTTNDGARFVVKVANTAEDLAITDFQIDALRHLEKNGLHWVPRVIPTTQGTARGFVAGDDALVLRIVTWMDGQLMRDTDVTAQHAGHLGRRLSQLDRAFATFICKDLRRVLLWDVRRAGDLEQLLRHVQDERIRDRLDEVLSVFSSAVRPRLLALPVQVIHNDANPENVLLNEAGDVSGIIDFGDMMHAPRVIEVSTAAAYLRLFDDNPLRLIRAFVSGYHQSSPLDAPEKDLLYDLVRTRLAMTITLLFWRLASREPGDPYREKTLAEEATAFDFLELLSQIGREKFAQSVCG